MTIYGLIDCNSFYCSCQRAFEPRLKHLPVVVLSNNDGCAIARTREAKNLGIKMGDPWHIVREQRKLSSVQWYSSNYPLYADMSRRVYQVLLEHVPRVEPYSIDEMFLDLTGLPGSLSERCEAMRTAVEQTTKIPTCIGWVLPSLKEAVHTGVKDGADLIKEEAKAELANLLHGVALYVLLGLHRFCIREGSAITKARAAFGTQKTRNNYAVNWRRNLCFFHA